MFRMNRVMVGIAKGRGGKFVRFSSVRKANASSLSHAAGTRNLVVQ